MNSKVKKIIAAAVIFVCIAGLLIALSTCGEPSDAKDSSKLSYDYDLSPYIKMGDYLGIEVEVPEISVTDAEVEDEIEYLLYYNSKTEQEKEGTVAKGDIINIDYTGYVGGKELEGGASTDYNYTVGGESQTTNYLKSIEGFDSGLVGKKIGDTVELSLTLPDNETLYGAAKGQKATFKVNLNYRLLIIEPKLTDEFVKEISDCDTVKEFRELIKNQLYNRKSQTAESDKQNAVWEKVIEGSEIIKYPEGPFEYYRLSFVSNYTDEAEAAGVTLETYITDTLGATSEEFYEEAKKFAESYVAEDLRFYSIVKAEGLTLTDAEYSEGRHSYYESYSGQFETELAFEEYYGESVIRTSLLWDKMITLITDAAVEKPVKSAG